MMELRNPLSRAQLNKLRPRPFVRDFVAADVPGSLLLGKLPAGYLVPKCTIEIKSSFDPSVKITVGDLLAVARFQAMSENDPEFVNTYETSPHFAYAVDTDVYIFLAGSSILGSGRVILYIE